MNKKRLPKSTYPNKYEIELDVDLDNFSYTGAQKVDLNVVEATNNIVLNSVGIEVTKAKMQTTKQDIPLEVNYIEEDEKIVFESQETLSEGVYELYIEFNWKLQMTLKVFIKVVTYLKTLKKNGLPPHNLNQLQRDLLSPAGTNLNIKLYFQ